ncbi:hypothetical protein A2154_01135 [Candidatus Gottesmanbacteria bacterium RBG_16_43_7]|uniref:EamA domain-containing protein n=1 Tax=Candidatus Gottesmanbacteria bacterium RBG_16_43_7 TaxID=1798373 RepID=A0A1F5ZB54_9BACT|nr:MAG: hypothetical protein A2154_01135 [Candidatus Gottesmanbacteria bacterium RBG_16_43_7]
MNWLLLTILAIMARSTYSLGTKIISRNLMVSPITQSFLLTLTSGILALGCAPLLGGISPAGIQQQTLVIILIIGASVFGNIIYFKGQKFLDTGTTQVAFSTILIWGAILSVVFLGSDFSLRQCAGIALLLGALILVGYSKKKLALGPGVIFIVVSAILFAVFQVASAEVSRSLTTGTYLLLSFFGTATTIALFYFRQLSADFKSLLVQLHKTLATTLFASGTSLLYIIFSFLAYKAAPDRGVVVVLLTSQAVLSVFFGIIFLRESDNWQRKITAGLLAFLAGILIKS